MVHVVLQFVVNPATVLHLVPPVVAVQLRALVELVVPNEGVAVGRIVGRFLGSLLGDGDGLASRTRLDGYLTGTNLGQRIGIYGDYY